MAYQFGVQKRSGTRDIPVIGSSKIMEEPGFRIFQAILGGSYLPKLPLIIPRLGLEVIEDL